MCFGNKFNDKAFLSHDIRRFILDILILAPDDHGDGNNAVTSGIEKMTTSVP